MIYRIFFFLIILGMVTQVIPFIVNFQPTNDQSGITITELSRNLPVTYEIEDYFKAEQFNRPIIPCILAIRITLILGLLALILSGIGSGIENRFGNGRWRWAARCLFFIASYILIYLLSTPYQVANYFHCKSYGLTDICFLPWLKLLAIQFPVPVFLFVLKCLLIFCLIHLFNRYWWVVSALFIFMIFEVAPEFFHNRPIDPVRRLKPLEAGPYCEQLEKIAESAGVRLDFMISDRSKRENTVNIYLSGRASNRYMTISDTFLEKFSPEETCIALAHELGHKVHDFAFLVSYKTLGFLYLLAGFLLASLITGRKKIESSARIQAVMIVFLSLLIVNYFFTPVTGAISRWDERLADRYALNLTGDADSFISLLVKGAKINLERLEIPSWEYYLFSDYPSLKERILYAKRFKWKNKPSG